MPGEGTGFDQTGAVLTGVTDNVIARLQKETPPETPPAAAPEPQPQQAPTPPAEPQPAAQQIPPAQTPPPSAFWESDYKGRRVALDRTQADYLINFALDAFENASAPQAPQPAVAPTPQGAPAAMPDDLSDIPPESRQLLERFFKVQSAELQAEIKELKEYKKQTEREARERQQQDELRQAHGALQAVLEKNEVYKQFSGNPRVQQLLYREAALQRSSNPSLSFESAVKLAIEDLQQAITHKQGADYLQTKVDQAKNKVEGSGGSSPAPGRKKFTAKDLQGDNESPVFQSSMRRAMAAVAEGR